MNIREYIIKIITAVMFTAAGAIYAFMPDKPVDTVETAVENTEYIDMQHSSNTTKKDSDVQVSAEEVKTITDINDNHEYDISVSITKIPEFTPENSTLVDINTNDAEILKTLPGIGPKKAEAILEYRRKYGDFRCKEDIMNVPGIKEGTFKKIKDLIDCR